MISGNSPFVLLDDARRNGASPARLYRDPVEIVSAAGLDEIAAMLDRIGEAGRQGLHVAGYLAYDAGGAFLPHIDTLSAQRGLLGWFGIFEEYQELEHDAVPSWLRDPSGAWLSSLRPDISRREYADAFRRVQDFIVAGDIYQANLTFPVSADYAGHPLALYAALRPRAAAGYGGIVWTGQQWHLSFSPELFFALKDGRVTTRPMKGTAERLTDSGADRAAAHDLATDPKQRAENLMIVDLLRNDLSQICEAGSVEVPQLFHVESYPTVHQMTSTVTGQLPPERDAVDVIKALFPCGSITGAPKIRAMQIVSEVEQAARGLYCGSIGRIDACGNAAFNVAIRTFSLYPDKKQVSLGEVKLGLGSGLVADSDENAEWAECLAKGDFARVEGYGFDLIETMRFDPAEGIARLELHLERMKESARVFGFEFDRHSARNQLHAATFHLDMPSKIRLLLAKSGAIGIEIRELPDVVDFLTVAIAQLPVDPHDYRLRHKISDREFYDQARKSCGAQEVLFVDRDGYLTEGSFTSIYVEKDGLLYTPQAGRGLLPSVLRRELIEQGRAVEADLTPDDLAGHFYVGNSLRGLISAKRVA